MLLPFLLYFSNIFKYKLRPLKVLFFSLIVGLLFIASQLYRGQASIEIDYDKLLTYFFVPFDAYDNGIVILTNIYQDNLLDLLFPVDISYLIESYLNFVPKLIWDQKPEVMGFWRIQRDFLPDLYTDTSGMSVSTSLPVDIILSFGLILGSLVIFSFGSFLKKIDMGLINVGYAYPFILLFSVDFSRGGFRSLGIFLLQIVIVGLFVIFFNGIKKYIKI
jgi:hypothetical protein